MTKEAWLKMVRKAFEELSPNKQDQVAKRALNRSVFVWGNLKKEELDRIWGAMRAVDLLSDCDRW